MGLFNAVKKQLRSVIEWENASANDVFQKWSESADEIKNASKLIVNPGQGCIFTYEGKVQSVLSEPGKYDIKTDNVPFITTVMKFMQAFESEHKTGFYFYRSAQILNQKWGTPSAIKYLDPTYKFPVGLKAFGNFSFQIKDPQAFFVNVVASAHSLTVDSLRETFVSRIVAPLADFLGEKKYSYLDIDSQREEIAQGLGARLKIDFGALGFDIIDFRIEGTAFDKETNDRINRIADLTAEAQAAAAAGVNFAQLKQLEALKDAANNSGGAAGLGVGMGAGVGMGQMMAQSMFANNMAQPQPPAAPQAAAPAASSPTDKLKKLKEMLDMGLITEDDFNKKKTEILSSM